MEKTYKHQYTGRILVLVSKAYAVAVGEGITVAYLKDIGSREGGALHIGVSSYRPS